ncbi:hypothetical protein PTSG_02655 [Salpingoeca rosetta]|uniref:NTF2 domain-containing protein n=1 Tax=Salpingoeca rosetta (strain ATCC 50818 / BSB-021) TaxID=946362 RepID=F2U2X7_SALR5|nr:uncharacterized protein PTSG_02655 [Salpingoeca rosetta]EGD81971.1 hypothetical protein PTSG_02655 [Salpingoeca rosetta]|eukprot:XP_004996154.1 hypothetical protein PTSG_02655 [Salpingoeca rosetta]
MAMEQQHHQHHQHHQSPPHQPHHHQPQQQPGTALAVPSQDTEVVAYEQDPNNLALMFCEVFFGMFDPPSFTTDLFFDDCELNLHVAPAGQIEQHQGSASVVHRLTKLPQQDNVLFRPGDGGIRGMLEPHGLLAVEVHGTVHSPGAVIGHFRQACLLAQDPFLQDTWRVRNINIECQLFPSLNG